MKFPYLISVLVRRWYVMIVGLMATAALAYGALAVSPPTYTARALVVLLPASSTVGTGGNPFLALDNLTLPARLVVATLGGESAQAEVAERFPDAEYSVTIEESTRGPIIAIDVADATPESALSALDFVAGEIPSTLERLQSDVGAPAQSAMTSMPITVDDEATKDTSGTVRVLIAAVGLGLVGTALLAAAVDGLARSRRLRISRSQGSEVELDREQPTEADEVPVPDGVAQPRAGVGETGTPGTGDFPSEPDPGVPTEVREMSTARSD